MGEATEEQWDAVVIGGGPAGTTAAANLAKRGHRVVMLEKEKVPGYRVGESLIPYCYFPLERLGVLDAIEAAGFTHKHSVQFVSPRGRVARPFYFSEHHDHPSSRSWQVERKDFDTIMRGRAEALGATVRMGWSATKLLETDGSVRGVTSTSTEGEVRTLKASVVIDASGRDGFVMRQRRWRTPETRLNRIAIWTYIEGAVRDPGRDEGATTIARIPSGGWFWLLPLADDRVSVGVVERAGALLDDGNDLEAAFHKAVTTNPWVAERLAPGKVVDRFRATRNYSYRSEHSASDGLLLCGDAFHFLDPVFSSGIFFALVTGERAAIAADQSLRGGESRVAFEAYADWLREAIEPLRQLVFAFYDTEFSFADLVRSNPALHGELTDCLIGHTERDFTQLIAAMGALTDLPEPATSGGVA
ncbi:MAG: NAD(P)/FAD-dependent oxidoreductase [Myxococcota bacterium]